MVLTLFDETPLVDTKEYVITSLNQYTNQIYGNKIQKLHSQFCSIYKLKPIYKNIVAEKRKEIGGVEFLKVLF